MVASLMAKLQAFNATKIPQDNAPIDPRSSPAHFNDTWTPWEGDPDPMHCAKPPPPPVPACVNGAGEAVHCAGSVDGLGLNASSAAGCTLAGWCSAQGYVGPSMEIQLVVDGTPTGPAVVGSIHRTIAGDHGFILQFECALAAGEGKKHTFAAVAKVNSSSDASFAVGAKCAREGRGVAC